ncbi:hypothetical protein AGLY_006334 [Aphis glycines]|uniref:Uncharacterized protein n=1 Tax=Aphis glycines TaxID=307491 RepID=A0A6G0TT34_APHGL|nr:hypothetical protein AGLY_006334 [Aphis glycines]
MQDSNFSEVFYLLFVLKLNVKEFLTACSFEVLQLLSISSSKILDSKLCLCCVYTVFSFLLSSLHSLLESTKCLGILTSDLFVLIEFKIAFTITFDFLCFLVFFVDFPSFFENELLTEMFFCTIKFSLLLIESANTLNKLSLSNLLDSLSETNDFCFSVLFLAKYFFNCSFCLFLIKLILFTECSEFKIGVELNNGLSMCLLLLMLLRICDAVLVDLLLSSSLKVDNIALILEENSESLSDNSGELSAVSSC